MSDILSIGAQALLRIESGKLILDDGTNSVQTAIVGTGRHSITATINTADNEMTLQLDGGAVETGAYTEIAPADITVSENIWDLRRSAT